MRARLGLSPSQLFIALLLALILVVMAVLQNQPQTVEPYDPNDTSSTGLRALVLWLEELGHPVTLNTRGSGLPTGPGLFLIHPSSTGDPDYYSDVDVTMTYSWVQRGGTLVLVGPTIPYTPLSDRFGVEQIETLTGMVSAIRQVQPLLPDRTRQLGFLLRRPHSGFLRRTCHRASPRSDQWRPRGCAPVYRRRRSLASDRGFCAHQPQLTR